MIERFYLDEWRQFAPWPTLTQVEQDLIISRALVCLYRDNQIKNALVFRGGTALNKLFLDFPARYSEDLDFVQIQPGGIGVVLDRIRSAIEWLGQPKIKLTERCAKLIYRYQSAENIPSKLKIEINTTEHYHVFGCTSMSYQVNSGWFKGNAGITTFCLDELMGSKLRALYQRRKGRDLFDMWLMFKKNKVNPDRVLHVFEHYYSKIGDVVTRAQFEKNLFEKSKHPDFLSDTSALLSEVGEWRFEKAYDFVLEKIIARLPGKPWNQSD
jgi:predicted nucleotidyltransferase component of viral defense system